MEKCIPAPSPLLELAKMYKRLERLELKRRLLDIEIEETKKEIKTSLAQLPQYSKKDEH